MLILQVKGRKWDLYGKSAGEAREKLDYDAEHLVRGNNKVDVIHQSGATTFAWSLDADTLTLQWLTSTQPPYKGIPDEVFQRALYMTDEFTRLT